MAEEMKMLEEKVYCFSEGEFSILADACGMRIFLCFNPEEGRRTLRKLNNSEYIQVVYELDKRGVIIQKDDKMVINREILDLIDSCNNSKLILRIIRRGVETHIPICLYLQENGGFVSAYPGKQKNEYIRISYHTPDSLETFLEDLGIIDSKEDGLLSGNKQNSSKTDTSILNFKSNQILIYSGNTMELQSEIVIGKDSPQTMLFRKGDVEESTVYEFERLNNYLLKEMEV